MNIKEKAVKGVFWSAMQKWGEQSISFIVFLVLARRLGPEVFGLVALSSVYLSFIQAFLDQGFAEAIIQRKELDDEHLDTAFWVSIGTGTLLTIISFVGAGLVADFFKTPQLVPIVQWLSFSFILRGLNSVQATILRRQFDFRSLAVRSLIGIIIGGLVGITMAYMGYGAWSLVGQQMSNLIVGVPLMWWVCNWRPGFKISAKHFKDLFTFGINITAFNVLNFFNRRSDNLLIGFYLGNLALGYYNIAYRILEIMIQLLTNITAQVALPTFSRLQHEPERMRQAFYSVTQMTSLISFPMFMGVAVMAPEIVRVLFGEKWLPSIPVMQVLSLIGILQSVFFFNTTVLLAMGKANWRLWINCLNAVTNFIAFISVIRWGIVAVAAAYAIRGYLFSPIPLFAIHKLIHIQALQYLRQCSVPLISSLVMVVVMVGTRSLLNGITTNTYVLLAVCSVVGLIVYLGLIQLLAPKLIRKITNLVLLALPKKFRKQV
jgi:O-antigen/teichoic acid export membrane protein